MDWSLFLPCHTVRLARAGYLKKWAVHTKRPTKHTPTHPRHQVRLPTLTARAVLHSDDFRRFAATWFVAVDDTEAAANDASDDDRFTRASGTPTRAGPRGGGTGALALLSASLAAGAAHSRSRITPLMPTNACAGVCSWRVSRNGAP
jgi:hypothetical protein